MKKFTIIISAAFITFNAMYAYAGNTAEVIIPGRHSPKYFRIDPKLKEGEDYLSKTIIFKLLPEYRQNAKTYSVDNLLPLQDFFNFIGAKDVKKKFPHDAPPAQERNALGQKLVDLSLIYSMKYTADLNLEKVINGMLSLGYFEYVEPWYIPKLHFNPNDPAWNTQQYHLKGNVTGSINTVDAWNLTQGSTSIVVGLTDTGTELNHPDLAANVYLNTADPIDGVDNDGDGFIDDYRGWDVGMNDNDPTWQGDAHGVATSGDACAVTNNNTGVASPGFNTKFMMCKVADASGALVAAYDGIKWLADFSASHGNVVKIISNSWGGGGGGAYGQNIIDYAAINKNCLILASAGNGGADQQVYPSSYNNVYRVASSTSSDTKSGFSDYGNDVDFAAPGSNIYSTWSGGSYLASSGTSMACPVAAGAAALVQAYFNYTNAFQIGEKLKQTCDPMPNSSEYNAGKLGKGRIDVNNALTQAAKSLAMNPINVTDGNDNFFMPGETLSITGTFINYLDPSSSTASATLTVVSGPGTVINGNFTIGTLATLATTNNNASPFTVSISNTAPINSVIKFKVTITDGSFTGNQYFSVTVNEDIVNITINDVFTTITSKGRLGYNLDNQQQGLGFEYQLPTPANLLYEMSLMIGISSTKVSDMFRGSGATGDTDFGSLVRAYQVNPAVVSDFDVDGKFNDAPAAANAIPVEVHHSAYAWATAPYRKFVIVKYVIKNTGTSTLNNLYAGIIADWDVENYAQNKGAWDATNKMGYVYQVGGTKYAAIKLLSQGGVTHYVVDNTSGGNGGVDPTAGTPEFSTQEKYTVLSTNRNADGYGPNGGDVFDCVSNGPFTINPGDSVTVAFALIAGDNLADIQVSACAAQSKYDNGCVIGVNDVENDNFWIWSYPNPVSNSITFNYNIEGNTNGNLTIMNSLGEIVSTTKVPKGKNSITVDVSKLSSGNYFYRLKANESVITKKFTIMR